MDWSCDTRFWCINLGDRDHFGRRIWEDNIEMDLQEIGWMWAWTEWSCLRIGTGGRLL